MYTATILIPLILAALQIPASPRVTEFSPSGEVVQVRQVRVRFSEAMVPMGDPELPQPFDIDCPVDGQARWSDSRNWLFDFEKDLEAGVTCRFTLRDDLRTLNGAELEGPREFSFNTGGPSVLSARPWEGASIGEDQAFVLQLSGDVQTDSVTGRAWFAVEGIGERLPLRVISGSQRQALIKAAGQTNRDPNRLIVIQAQRPFPNDVDVQLTWGKGIRTGKGVATSQDQFIKFRVRRQFLVEFSCSRENARSDCVPVTPMRLQFTASIPWEQARLIRLEGDDGFHRRPQKRRWDRDSNQVSVVRFAGPFPPRSRFTITLPDHLEDLAGRPLANRGRFPLTVRTDEFPPLAKFAGRFGILERKAGALLPVTLRHLEDELPAHSFQPLVNDAQPLPGRSLRLDGSNVRTLLDWLLRLRKQGRSTRDRSIFQGIVGDEEGLRSFSVPKPNGGRAFEVVGIPLAEAGFHVVELESRILGEALLDEPRPMFVKTGVLVTDMAVHLKRGRESSLAWVTSLESGQPVARAQVDIWDCMGRRLAGASTDEQGLVRFGPIDAPPVQGCDWYDRGKMLATARKGDDFSFTHGAWDQGIEPWRFGVPVTWGRPQPFRASTIFARNLLRAGETVHMKHVLRHATMEGFRSVPPLRRPKGLLIRHLGSRQEYRLPLIWTDEVTAVNQWTAPAGAHLGVYETYLAEKTGKDPGRLIPSGRFRIEEFRVPLATASIDSPSRRPVAPSSLDVDLQVRYLAGGTAAEMPVLFRYRIAPRAIPAPEGLESFVFANGPVVGEPDGAPSSHVERTSSQELKLDQQGGARIRIEDIPTSEVPLGIQAELEFRDPSGETQTVSRLLPLWPSKKLVGIKAESWIADQESLRLQAAVIDIEGRPVAGQPVQLDLFQVVTYSSRKRLVGGFYSYEHRSETRRLRTFCQGETDARGRLFCQGASPVSGQVTVQARLQEAGPSAAHLGIWAAGEDDWWFHVEDHDRIDVIPEKPAYEIGETARFQVRMPFRQATALVSVEREGVIQAFVRPLSGRNPVVEVPIASGYAPNVYVSVLVVRGRVGRVQPTALIDLGRPTYRFGLGEIKVGWGPHRLDVKVESDRTLYRPRETAQVGIQVLLPDGQPAAGAEVAVAAIDEGLLELSPNPSWQLLSNMMGRRSYEVHTATAQSQVIGKRHFGLKALAPGGGGGAQTGTRTLFDTLLLWEGRLVLDEQGRAQVEVPLNDSLTSFRIVAVANDRRDRFGTGSTTIRSSQDLILLSGLPATARQGDQVKAEFTLRNTSDQPMKIEVRGLLHSEDGQKVTKTQELPTRRVELGPGRAETVLWDVDVLVDTQLLRYEVEADSGQQSDRLSALQKVVAVTPVRQLQGTLVQLDAPKTIIGMPPAGAIPGRGGIEIGLSASLIEGLDGVRQYMRAYPYVCLEQKLSKSIALQDRKAFNRVMSELPAYLDGDGFAKYFPGSIRGYPILTAYVLSISNQARWEIPPAPRYRMQRALDGFVTGRLKRGGQLRLADLTIRKLAALDALSRYGAARPSMIDSIILEPNLWPTSALLDWIGLLKRMENAPQREDRLREAEGILRARIHYEGTSMAFSNESRDRLWWLMAGADQNSVRSLLALLDSPQWTPDLPRMAVGALQRRRRGHWDTSPANAWGILAMAQFSQRFEAVSPGGSTRIVSGDDVRVHDWATAPQGGSIDLGWPKETPSRIVLSQLGQGRPWVETRFRAAQPRVKAFSAGYRMSKTWTAVQRKNPDVWSRGDLVRVRLEIDAQADRTWVVVDDPIPTGASVVGNLGRDSSLARRGEGQEGRAWKAFEERSFLGYRAYYEYVPKGRWTLEYTLRLNQAGHFLLPATRVEAMYSPEMFGEIPNAPVVVEE